MIILFVITIVFNSYSNMSNSCGYVYSNKLFLDFYCLCSYVCKTKSIMMSVRRWYHAVSHLQDKHKLIKQLFHNNLYVLLVQLNITRPQLHLYTRSVHNKNTTAKPTGIWIITSAFLVVSHFSFSSKDCFTLLTEIIVVFLQWTNCVV